jgi:hypothetical protein
MLKLFSRDRYLAGNLCLVLFLAFLLSLAAAASASANAPAYEFKAQYKGQDLSTQQSAATPVPQNTIQLTLVLGPVTAADFQTIFEKLWFKVSEGTISSSVYLKDTVYSVAYEVYQTVYHIYKIVYDFVYSAQFTPGTTYVLTFYEGEQKLKEYFLTLEPKPPEPGPVPGPAPAPAPPETKTEFGTVAWDKEAGKGTAKVDASLAANLIQAAKQKGQAAVDLRVSVPSEVTLKSFTSEVPAKAVLDAVAANVVPLIGTANLFVALDVAKIPAEIKAELAAKPEVKLAFTFTILPEAEAKQATAGLPATYKVAGSVVTLQLAFDGKALPGAVTLSYGTGATAGSGLLAAVNLFGLFGDGRLAAAGVDEDKLGIYRYDEPAKAWEYVGGRVDKAKKTVTARLAAVSLAKYAVMAFDKTFADLVGHWSKRDVEIMAARHIARGVTDDRFDPNGLVTRAQFAALLVRTLGIAEAKPAAATFKDVAPQDWCYGAVEAAKAAGLVRGYADGTFRPDAPITREELASMVHRALIWSGKKPAVAGRVEELLARFRDANQIGGWARESVAAAVSEDILRGRDGAVAPKANASRAEATVMLKRVLVSLGEISK